MFRNTKKGFTLVEMMVVVALTGIILVMIVSNAQKQRVRARDNVRIAGMQEIRLALEQYKLSCGQYPSTLELDADNGNGSGGNCPGGQSLEDFLPHIPKVPTYSGNNNQTGQGEDYRYTGLSSSTGGPCYEYHIAVELEYGSADDYSGGENAQNLASDHDWGGEQPFNRRCQGAGQLISDADDDLYGLYDFRSKSY